MQNFDIKHAEYLKIFENYLDEFLKNLNGVDTKLKEAIEYSVKNGGKRVRPVLCLATAEMLNIDAKKVLKYALAIEFIHAYSLVHDDLPAMDNDDYRRGKLSTHKKFGEALGILTGDALLNLAMEIAVSGNDFSLEEKNAIQKIFELAGAKGMISGQVLDLSCEKSNSVDQETLYEIYEKKTCDLIKAPILVSSILSGGKFYSELESFAFNLGALFQITDDILDVESNFETLGKTVKKDEKSDKLTCVKLWGLDGAKKKAKGHYDKCISLLNRAENSWFLIKYTDKIYLRKS